MIDRPADDRCAVVTLDRGFRVTSWNAGAGRIFGWTAAEAIGQPARVLAPPDGDGLGRMRDLHELGWWEGDVVVANKHGEHVAVHNRTDAERVDGQIVGYRSVSRELPESESFRRARRDASW